MVVKPRLPKAPKVLSGDLGRLVAQRRQSFSHCLLQTSHPALEGHVVRDSYEEVNMVGHEDVTSGACVKFNSAPGVFPKSVVHGFIGDNPPAQQRVERDE